MATTHSVANDGKVLIWDLPTRMFHWLLVLSLAASWWTAEAGIEWIDWHFRLGYFAAGLVIFRVIWGFVGPRHARFSSFLRGPGAVADYVATLPKKDSNPTPGHNPVGAIAVVVMLLAIAIQAGTGLFASDDIFTDAPFHPLVSDDTASLLTSIHHLNFNILLGLAGLHIVAVLFYVLWKKQGLIRAMLTGRKKVEGIQQSDGIASSRLLLAIVLAALVGLAVAGAVSQAPEPEEDFY